MSASNTKHRGMGHYLKTDDERRREARSEASDAAKSGHTVAVEKASGEGAVRRRTTNLAGVRVRTDPDDNGRRGMGQYFAE